MSEQMAMKKAPLHLAAFVSGAFSGQHRSRKSSRAGTARDNRYASGMRLAKILSIRRPSMWMTSKANMFHHQITVSHLQVRGPSSSRPSHALRQSTPLKPSC